MDQTVLSTLAAGHPLIDIDLTVVVQFVLFLVLFVVANKLSVPAVSRSCASAARPASKARAPRPSG